MMNVDAKTEAMINCNGDQLNIHLGIIYLTLISALTSRHTLQIWLTSPKQQNGTLASVL